MVPVIGGKMGTIRHKFSFLCSVLFLLTFTSGNAFALKKLDPFENWLIYQYSRAVDDMFANIHPDGSAPGAVAASPSREFPDYYYHWVRDASLVMNNVVDFYQRETNPTKKAHLRNLITDFAEFSRRNQLTPNIAGNPGDTGDGEVKFHMDGKPYELNWGRPQNDGPALRASTLIKFSKLLIANGEIDYVKNHFYDGKIPTESVIKADLEYVAYHWRDKSVDLWEEVKGQHFYTRLVQRKALLDGAELADLLGDHLASDFYRAQVPLLDVEIEKHWDKEKGYIVATLDGEGSVYEKKKSNLDIAIILAVLHTDSDFYSPTHEKVLATAMSLIKSFDAAYEINRNRFDGDQKLMAAALGRYVEDTYNGYHTDGEGNPWILATNAMAELISRAKNEWIKSGHIAVTPLNHEFLNYAFNGGKFVVGETIYAGDSRFGKITEGLKTNSDAFLRRVRFHANPDGTLSEQLNRRTGIQEGAPKLTWSCSSVITAVHAR
jgi:glucoamylase